MKRSRASTASGTAGADALQVDDEGREIGRTRRSAARRRPRSPARRPPRPRAAAPRRRCARAAAAPRAPRATRTSTAQEPPSSSAPGLRGGQEGPRRERDEGGDAEDRGGPGREGAEPREPARAARRAPGPQRSQRSQQHQRDHRHREQVDRRALDVVERVRLGVVVRGQDQALLGRLRGQTQQHVVLRLGADPAEDGDLPLELREQQQRDRRGDRQRRAGAPGAHQPPVEQATGERDHAGQAQRPGLGGEGDQRDVEARALESCSNRKRAVSCSAAVPFSRGVSASFASSRSQSVMGAPTVARPAWPCGYGAGRAGASASARLRLAARFACRRASARRASFGSGGAPPMSTDFQLPPLGGNPSSPRQGTTPGSFARPSQVGGPRAFASPDTPGMPQPSGKTAWDFMPGDWKQRRRALDAARGLRAGDPARARAPGHRSRPRCGASPSASRTSRAEQVRDEVAAGRMVIPANKVHLGLRARPDVHRPRQPDQGQRQHGRLAGLERHRRGGREAATGPSAGAPTP